MHINKLFRRKDRDILIVLILFGLWGILPLFAVEDLQTLFGVIFVGAYSFVCYLLSLEMSDIQDTLWYNYKKSVFYDGYKSYWKPDHLRKYNNRDPKQGHKKFTIPILRIEMDIPDFWFNAVKLAKIIEIWLEWNIIFYLLNLSDLFSFYSIPNYVIFTAAASIITYYMHKWSFSGWMTKK